jgi:hypothetical protein
LPDGHEEWLEFWRSNHLLPPFAEVHARREEGSYGGRMLAFLSLADLIRSKETERDKDWRDISFLEEVLDNRVLNQAKAGTIPLDQALAGLRSRRGLESALQSGVLNDVALVRQALAQSKLSVAQAILLPSAGAEAALPIPTVPIEPVVLKRLRTADAGSALHLALIEVVRRRYILAMQDADAADKQAIRAAQANPPADKP